MATLPQSIINTILADVNAIVADLQQLVSSYRLLVGAAEEIHRTLGVSPDIFNKAVERFDRAGSLIDIIIELLCCKISYSSDFLSVTCAPVDLYRLLQNRSDFTDTPHHTAEQILQLELLRRALDIACPNQSPFSKFNSPDPSPYSPPSNEANNPPNNLPKTDASNSAPKRPLENAVKAELFTEINKELFSEIDIETS